MNNIEKRRPLMQEQIKMFAIIAMTLNHVAGVFMEQGTFLCELFTAIGHFTAPVMVYFLVEGYYYTSSRKRYLGRLLLFGLISEAPYWLAFWEVGAPYLNILFTLSLCFGMIWVIENVQNKFVKVILLVLSFPVSMLFDWFIFAPALTLIFVYYHKNPDKMKTTVLLSILIAFLRGANRFYGWYVDQPLNSNLLYSFMEMAAVAIATLCILFLYNGKRSEKNKKFSKWFFYAYYPAHLLIIGLIRIVL